VPPPATSATSSLRDVRWSVHAWQLLLGRVAADLRAQLDEGYVAAHVKATRGHVSLSEVRASTSLSTLRPVLPISGLRGQANLTLSALELDVAKACPPKSSATSSCSSSRRRR
jgi:hypothetical protein